MTPADSQTVISLGAALAAGLIGSTHCFAMCGGLAGALGVRARALGQSVSPVAYSMFSQLGRIVSYSIAGAIVGTFGSALTAMMSWVHLATVVRVVAGVLLLAVALRAALGWNAFASLERVGGRLWQRHLSALAPAAMRRAGFTQAFAMGALWGWLPCGLVYSMLLFAAFSGNPLQGAAIMLAFGTGTLPSMFTSSLLAGRAARAFSAPGVRWAAAGLLTTFGAWTIVIALAQHGHYH